MQQKLHIFVNMVLQSWSNSQCPNLLLFVPTKTPNKAFLDYPTWDDNFKGHSEPACKAREPTLSQPMESDPGQPGHARPVKRSKNQGRPDQPSQNITMVMNAERFVWKWGMGVAGAAGGLGTTDGRAGCARQLEPRSYP